MAKYSVTQSAVTQLLADVHADKIAIPELQRPFVWDSVKVRDLMDSLYKGYPIGYLIAWRNPDVRLKDGGVAQGRMILIDGQQRVTALAAAVLGQQVVNKDYRKVHIRIAFHPIREEFKVADAATLKDPAWIPDVSSIIGGEVGLLKAVRSYEKSNPGIGEEQIERALTALSDGQNAPPAQALTQPPASPSPSSSRCPPSPSPGLSDTSPRQPGPPGPAHRYSSCD